jgi:hypothetical protein
MTETTPTKKLIGLPPGFGASINQESKPLKTSAAYRRTLSAPP